MSANTIEALKGYDHKLHQYLKYRVHNPCDVDDLAQEVYTRMIAAKDCAIENPLAYLYGIARHVVADHRTDISTERRCIGRRTEMEDDDWSAEPSCVLPDDIADRLNLQQQIDKALAQLPPTHQAVLLCHKRDGLSYAETAKKLGLSEFTVEKYVTQGKARLRTMSWER